MIYSETSKRMLKYQKAKAKLIEYNIAQENYPVFPLNSNELSYPTIYALSKYAEAVIDGSSLGQVASQTLPNILATREDLDVPVLSPLIGLDKVEITRIAEKIGTFEISKRDDGGCKAVPRYPETKADLELVKEVKEQMNQEEELEKAFKTIEF